MTTPELCRRLVELHVSDPWEFGTDCGEGPFRCRVVDATEAAALTHLEIPLRYRGTQIVAAIVRPRGVGQSMNILLRQGSINSNFLFLPHLATSLGELSDAEPGIAAIGHTQIC
jgi:hypothetical protein